MATPDLQHWVMLHVAAERVLGAFASARVETLTLKGLALSGSLYADGARPMRDVDVLVRDPTKARAVLRELGAQPVPTGARPLAMTTRPAWGWITAEGAHIDLHQTVGAPLRWRPDLDGLFERAVPHPVGDVVSLRPADEDLLLTLAIDAAKDEFSGKPHVFEDIRRVVERLELDWGALTERSRRWRCNVALWTALKLAEAEAPEDVMRRIRPRWAKRALLSRVLDGDGMPPGLWRQLRVGSLLTDSWWRFGAASGRFVAMRGADWALSARSEPQATGRSRS